MKKENKNYELLNYKQFIYLTTYIETVKRVLEYVSSLVENDSTMESKRKNESINVLNKMICDNLKLKNCIDFLLKDQTEKILNDYASFLLLKDEKTKKIIEAKMQLTEKQALEDAGVLVKLLTISAINYETVKEMFEIKEEINFLDDKEDNKKYDEDYKLTSNKELLELIKENSNLKLKVKD